MAGKFKREGAVFQLPFSIDDSLRPSFPSMVKRLFEFRSIYKKENYQIRTSSVRPSEILVVIQWIDQDEHVVIIHGSWMLLVERGM